MKNFLWNRLDFLTEKSHTMIDVILFIILFAWANENSVGFLLCLFLAFCIFIFSNLIDAFIRPLVVEHMARRVVVTK